MELGWTYLTAPENLWAKVNLRPCWSNMLGELASSLHSLSDTLGDDHDLAELRCVLLESLHVGGNGDKSHVLIDLIDRSCSSLLGLWASECTPKSRLPFPAVLLLTGGCGDSHLFVDLSGMFGRILRSQIRSEICVCH